MKVEVCHWIPPGWKNCSSLILAECLWRQNSECFHSWRGGGLIHCSSSNSFTNDKPCSAQLPTNKIESASISSYVWIRPVKDGLCRQHFPDNDTVITDVKEWVTSASVDFYENSMQALDHCRQKSIANSDDHVEQMVFCSWKLALFNVILVPSVSVLIYIEINKRHYFWSNPCMLIFLSNLQLLLGPAANVCVCVCMISIFYISIVRGWFSLVICEYQILKVTELDANLY